MSTILTRYKQVKKTRDDHITGSKKQYNADRLHTGGISVLKQHSKAAKHAKNEELLKAVVNIDIESDEEKLKKLKDFDLDLTYGPCVGITRLERWERAFQYGLNPPLEVQELLEKSLEKPDFQLPIWKTYELC